MTTLTIRRGRTEDAALLSELAARIFWDTFAAANTAEDMDAYMKDAFSLARQGEELADPRTTAFLAFVGDQPAGYATLRTGSSPAVVIGDRPVELVRLYADRAWHGRGIGAALLQACFDEAVASGQRTMWLGVWEHNARAIAFYRKAGFVECGSHVFRLGSDDQIDLLMTRPL